MNNGKHSLAQVERRLKSKGLKRLLKGGTVSLQTSSKKIEIPILERGISLGFLIALTQAFGLHKLSTYQVVSEFIKPVTEGREREGIDPTRFSELPTLNQYFGKADTFVSHCWKGNWGDLVAAVSDGFPLSRIVWIDIFAITQHPQIEALQDDLNALQSVIEEVPYGTTLVWNPQTQTDSKSNPIQRAWCLFEIHTTIQTDNALVIMMGGANQNELQYHDSFKFVTESNVDILTEHVFSTDIRKAEASREEDLDRIHKMIETQGGFDELNSRVRTAVFNNWRIMEIPGIKDALMGSREAVKNSLKNHDPETYEGDPGGSLVHDLVHGNMCVAAELVMDCGADINLQTKKGNTPLHFAAEGGRLRMCKLLLDRGAKFNFQNGKMETPLHLAAKYGRVEVVKLLLDAGANKEMRDSGNYLPEGLAALDKMPGCKEVLKELNADYDHNPDKSVYDFLCCYRAV